jgi:polyisoprenoid-binding protein YceI
MTTTRWVLDTTHSEVQFKVKHLMISTVTGQFNTFEGYIDTETDDFSAAKANIIIDVNSISTNNAQRDAHLKASDFFDLDNHPQITFTAEKIKKAGDEKYIIEGVLSLRGVSKPISFDAELGGVTKDPWGNTRAGFSVTGKIDRKDFGLTFNALTETGGLALGEIVTFIINAQFVKQVLETADSLQHAV